MFGDFEITAIKNPNFGASRTIYHNQTNQFVVASYQSKMSEALARNVCWAVAGGYVARYRSDAKLPDWIRQGTRGLVSRTMFPAPNEDAADKRNVRKDLSNTHSLRGIMSATEIATDRRTMARSLVTYLVKSNPAAFGQFFQDIKLGQSWETALATNFGITPDQLARSFAQQYGVTNVSP